MRIIESARNSSTSVEKKDRSSTVNLSVTKNNETTVTMQRDGKPSGGLSVERPIIVITPETENTEACKSLTSAENEYDGSGESSDGTERSVSSKYSDSDGDYTPVLTRLQDHEDSDTAASGSGSASSTSIFSDPGSVKEREN